MPLLLVFALIAACLPIDWPAPPFDPPVETALSLTGGAVTLILGIAFALRTWVVRTLRRDPSRRIEVARVYNRWRRHLFFVNLTTAAACVLVFGWGWLITQREFFVFWHGQARLAPFAELLVPLPYFVVLIGCWLIHYDAERALHRVLHHDTRSFWSRPAYVLHNLRQFALLAMLPVSLFVTNQTLARFAPETTRSDMYRIATLCAVPLLLLLMPLVLRPVLGLKTMPRGPIRDQLESLAKRLNFRCTDFLLWPTHGAAANAMITGLLPQVRYVVFTDRILEELPPDELDAVFGHEIGHAKHGHIWLYGIFLVLSLSVLAALLLFLAQQIDSSGVFEQPEYKAWMRQYGTWLALPPVFLVAGYLFVVFGALSRRCERQADLYGCKAVSCGDPACTGHDAATVYPKGGNCLCPTGIRTFTRALERVGDLNGVSMVLGSGRTGLGRFIRGVLAWLRAWQHGPMPRRVAYLLTLLDNIPSERRFQKRLFVFKWVLMLTLIGALLALGEAVGWKDLFEAL